MTIAATDLEVILCRQPTTVAAEWAWGQGLCEELLCQGVGRERVKVIGAADPPTAAQALQVSRAAFIGVVLDDVSFWGPQGWTSLARTLDDMPRVGAIGPVSNEASLAEQRAAPPFLYQTPSLLRLACEERCERFRGQWLEVPALDPFAFLIRRQDLRAADPQLALAELPAWLSRRGSALAVALDTYVHRYARMHDQPRPDLQEWVPRDAMSVLDLGCATGVFGAALKLRQGCRVTGIELNPNLAETAASRLDKVVQQSIEEIPSAAFADEFDCIVCGDVLEHLIDPWAVVAKLAGWLRPGGRIVATLPNVGHWSLVADLIRGRWDLIPFGLLCWGHLRFFTKPGIARLFTGNALRIEHLVGLKEELPAAGKELIQTTADLVRDADRDSLETSEFLVVARKDQSTSATSWATSAVRKVE